MNGPSPKEQQGPRFSLAARAKSFVYAARGMRTLVLEEHNARIHLMATVIVFAAGLCFRLPLIEWALLFVSIAMVWVTESLNTAIEYLADAITTEQNNNIRNAKDVAAGAVLLAAIFATIIGGLVFWPHVFPETVNS